MSLITKKDLVDAIEKTQGQKNLNSNACMKLAAYYVLMDHLSESVSYLGESQSEFVKLAIRTDYKELLNIMDELMDKIEESTPKLYFATIEKLK